MRTIEYTISVKKEQPPITEGGPRTLKWEPETRRGKFHQWTVEGETGGDICACAIVEREDGSIDVPTASTCKFLD